MVCFSCKYLHIVQELTQLCNVQGQLKYCAEIKAPFNRPLGLLPAMDWKGLSKIAGEQPMT